MIMCTNNLFVIAESQVIY